MKITSNEVPSYPDKRRLYRFPWSLNDNPQGWVEVTDMCNLSCRGCYRQRLEGHKSLKKIEEEIHFLKRWRNCDDIALAGGEPVLHPEIVEIVRFITAQGLKPFMLGNGVALNKEILRDLKNAGLVGVGLHIDMFQNRPGWEGKDEMALCTLREQIADMVYEVGGISCNFNITVYKENIAAIPQLIEWAIYNSKKVQGFTFMTYRAAIISDDCEYHINGNPVMIEDSSLGYASSEETAEDIEIQSTDIWRIIRKRYPLYEPSAYLGGTKDHASFKWLDGMVLCCGGRLIGSVGKKTMEFVQVMHHFVFGRYVIYLKNKSTGKKIFVLALFDKNIRQALVKYIGNPLNLFRSLHTVGIAIVQAPDVRKEGDVDMCESCPDITFFKGRLVNSCRLDEYRKFGNSLSVKRISKEELKEVTCA